MPNLNKIPQLTLVGAGPGDPELITLKAINALRNADVVLFDALANEELLEYCHPLCEKIYVGKRGHKKGITQDSINFLIAEKAYEKGHVVRLKGGDSFVFGRGMEEIEFATLRGIKCSYVPGISSVFSGGNFLIPLTDRRVSDGFWVITGHKSDKSFAKDLELAVKSNSTIILLMAMSKLEFIAKQYADANRAEIPVCIIQNASTAKEKMVIGKVGQLANMAFENNLSNPAIIIIGEVVNYSKYSQMDYSKISLEVELAS
ncbi:uroporphyrinogen-III C-methyltransferase [Lacihabitans sp. LS3-19]|uniref:uroporphyrinogen-III C-methyltransferase n=1 Tax=Lacihabitans sp. LS3-19 TaxID=2487335 RepID=UPI0020CDD32A|nr:uroporphyrinogen-III C-methyltransferase [Lacihabitans sp. LS3-19]MCP9767018.1 uroporphyrinogen-III C-methyltransferase [Lacihabitans sp. LS3-19]